MTRTAIGIVVFAVCLHSDAGAQGFVGVGIGGLSVPHSGQTDCRGKRSAPLVPTADLRAGYRVSKYSIGARVSGIAGLEDDRAVDCFPGPNDEYTQYSYDNRKPYVSFDANLWRWISEFARLGAEVGFLPGQSTYAGVGMSIKYSFVGFETVGRLHRVEYITRDFRGTQLLNEERNRSYLPGLLVRIAAETR